MLNYQEARVKLKNAELNKSKCAAKNKAGTVLTLNKKNVEDEELPHELFLTTRQTTTIRNTFANNKSTDTKLSKSQISQIFKSGTTFGSFLGNLGKNALANIAITLATDNLPGLISNLTSNAINLKKKVEKELSQQEMDLLNLFQMKIWMILKL